MKTHILLTNLPLTLAEQQWLADYCRVLQDRYGDVVEAMILYGSKARGDAGVDSDIEIVLCIHEGDWKIRKQIAYEGYALPIGEDVVPSILVCTRTQWNEWKHKGLPFIEAIDHDGISIR